MPYKKILCDKDVIEIAAVHVAAIGISFTTVENTLKIFSLFLAIGYTAWKWAVEYKKESKKSENGNKTNS